MKILGILHDIRIFCIGKGSFYRTLKTAEKIPALLLYDYHLLLEDEWNALLCTSNCYKMVLYNYVLVTVLKTNTKKILYDNNVTTLKRFTMFL